MADALGIDKTYISMMLIGSRKINATFVQGCVKYFNLNENEASELVDAGNEANLERLEPKQNYLPENYERKVRLVRRIVKLMPDLNETNLSNLEQLVTDLEF